MRTHTTADTLERLIRHPASMATQVADRDVRSTTTTLFGVTLAAAIAFGACIGSYRGELQILYAALKFPLVILLTGALIVPAQCALKAALGHPTAFAREALVMFAALALSTVVMASLTPLLLVVMSVGFGYHAATLATVTAAAIGGAFGLLVLARSMPALPRSSQAAILGTTVLLFAATGSELGWRLRPFLLRPAASAPVFYRDSESSFIESLNTSVDSARGRYRGESTTEAASPYEHGSQEWHDNTATDPTSEER